MSAFVRSQIDGFPGKDYVFTERGRSQIKLVEGKNNIPINLDMITSIYPSSVSISAPQYEYYVIVFSDHDINTITRWWYPPTDAGKAQRDADLQYLYDNYVAQCPAIESNIKK